jgi:DNA-binding response OmpR family regulator
MKILLAEDDYGYNESIKEYLESLGYRVDAFFDGEKALDAVMEKEYHLLLLDIKMPKLDGHKLIQHIRGAKLKIPIIIITSLVDIDSISIGYQLGCNDYLKKPFELKELEFRIHELIKKYYDTDNESKIKISDDTVFEFETGKLIKAGNDIILTSKEIDIVRFLLQRKNTFCSVELLREYVWDGKEINYADVRMHILKIRLKTGHDFIKSSRGLGYKIDVIR